MELLVASGIGWLIGLAGIWLLFSAVFKSTSPLISADFPIKFWLIIGVVGSSIASLIYGTPQPAGSMFMVGLNSPATVHRGWPLPWYGLVGLDMMFAPFTFLIDTTIWIVVTCGLVRLLCMFTHCASLRVTHPLFIQGTVVGVILLAFLLPLILPGTLIMNWLGL